MKKSGSKRYRALLEALGDVDKFYSIEEAVEKFKALPAVGKKDDTVELSVKLGVDAKKLQQPVRNSVVLPNGVGKPVRVLVFAEGEDANNAKSAGADYVGGQELADKIKAGFLDFDSVVATPEMMKTVAPLGRVLGPRGLMPNPKTGTVTKDLEKIIGEIKKGRIDFKMDKDGNIGMPVGKISFSGENLVANIKAAINSMFVVKPSNVRGNYMKSANISLAMSPSLKLDVAAISQEGKN